jgi:hypothetical protein
MRVSSRNSLLRIHSGVQAQDQFVCGGVGTNMQKEWRIARRLADEDPLWSVGFMGLDENIDVRIRDSTHRPEESGNAALNVNQCGRALPQWHFEVDLSTQPNLQAF